MEAQVESLLPERARAPCVWRQAHVQAPRHLIASLFCRQAQKAMERCCHTGWLTVWVNWVNSSMSTGRVRDGSATGLEHSSSATWTTLQGLWVYEMPGSSRERKIMLWSSWQHPLLNCFMGGRPPWVPFHNPCTDGRSTHGTHIPSPSMGALYGCNAGTSALVLVPD